MLLGKRGTTLNDVVSLFVLKKSAGRWGSIMEFDYNCARWKRKRAWIFKRDGYMCCRCRRYGKKTPATVVHHKKHVDEYPELAYEDDNLESLCNACHNKAHPEKAKHWRY